MQRLGGAGKSIDGEPLTGTARCTGCAWPPVRPARCGTSSSPTASPAASAASAWSPATLSWGRSGRGEPARCSLSTMQNALRRQPHVGHAEGDVAPVKAMLHSVYDQPDRREVHARRNSALHHHPGLAPHQPTRAERYGQAVASVASTACRDASAREVWLLTVPSLICSSVAVSATDRPSQWRSSTVLRCMTGSC